MGRAPDLGPVFHSCIVVDLNDTAVEFVGPILLGTGDPIRLAGLHIEAIVFVSGLRLLEPPPGVAERSPGARELDPTDATGAV
jgi:hypothetical protein